MRSRIAAHPNRILIYPRTITCPPSFLTREGYRKLQDELEYLRTEKRQEIAERLHEAMEGGELIENAEYEAAKNEQAFVEGRIKELEILLATARVIDEANVQRRIVQVGTTVTIQEEGVKKQKSTPSLAPPKLIRLKGAFPTNRRWAKLC